MLKSKLLVAGVLVAAGAGGLGAAHLVSAQSQPATQTAVQSQTKDTPDPAESTTSKADTDNVNNQQGAQDQQGTDQAEKSTSGTEKDTGGVDNQQGNQQGPNDTASGPETPDTNNN